MNQELRQLHDVLLDLVGFFNQPQRDAMLIREAGVDIDRALFPLLVRVERRGPLGIGELAGLVGRDYTTVSRQVAKLESMGLVTRQPGERDRRVSVVVVTEAGRAMNQAFDAAREKLMWPLLSQWSTADRKDLTRLLRRLVDDAEARAGRSEEC
ncbi:MAG TPA: MarR family transcriptional regulator [Burkholderiaceae bacterium]|jgi:DNA-binding MarR family transcriptional regulator